MIHQPNILEGKLDQDENLVESLSKKHQLFLDSPNGEINVYLILSNEAQRNNSFISDDISSRLPSNTLNNTMNLNMNVNMNIKSMIKTNVDDIKIEENELNMEVD